MYDRIIPSPTDYERLLNLNVKELMTTTLARITFKDYMAIPCTLMSEMIAKIDYDFNIFVTQSCIDFTTVNFNFLRQ